MKPLRWFLGLVLLQVITVPLEAATASEAADPAAVVQALYHSARAHFGFDADTIKVNRPWLTPDLYSRLLKKANEPVAKGDAPDIEMDVFLNSQELPDKISVGKAVINQGEAKVEVTLSLESEKWRPVVLLKQVNGAWKVDDVVYGGKNGKLTDLLK